MEKKPPFQFVFLMAALFAGVLPGATGPLSWELAVKEASKTNPDLAAALESVRSADALYSGSYSGFLPQLSANGGYTHGNTQNNGLGSTTIRNQYSVGLSATESIFAGFKDVGKIAKTKSNFEAAKAALQIAKAKLGFDLKSAFTSALYGNSQIKLTREIAKRRKDNLRLVRLRFEGGRENKGSFLLSQAALAQSEFEASQAERAAHLSERNLIRVLGNHELKTTEVVGNLSWKTPENISDFTALASSTPEVLQAIAQSRAADADVTISQSQFFPAIDVNGAYTKLGETFPLDTNRWSVGVAISFPFFPGTTSLYNYQSANADYRRIENQRKSIEDQALVKLEQTHSAFLDATGNQAVAKEFLIAAEARAIIARGKYQTGLMSFEDWDQIENDLIARQKTELQTQKDLVLAQAAWDQAQGKSDIP